MKPYRPCQSHSEIRRAADTQGEAALRPAHISRSGSRPAWWTNRSSPPSSGVMKPKPLVELNHLTVPVAFCPSAMARVQSDRTNLMFRDGAFGGAKGYPKRIQQVRRPCNAECGQHASVLQVMLCELPEDFSRPPLNGPRSGIYGCSISGVTKPLASAVLASSLCSSLFPPQSGGTPYVAALKRTRGFGL